MSKDTNKQTRMQQLFNFMQNSLTKKMGITVRDKPKDGYFLHEDSRKSQKKEEIIQGLKITYQEQNDVIKSFDDQDFTEKSPNKTGGGILKFKGSHKKRNVKFNKGNNLRVDRSGDGKLMNSSFQSIG